jgi:ATP-dependent RNA helicase SUPV3L1/SUV3
VSLIADETLQGADRERVLQRCQDWVTQAVAERLKPLVEIGAAEDVDGLGRGIAFRLRENLGVLRREEVAQELKSLDQTARAQLRRYGVRFGAFNIFFPVLLKPAAADLLLTLWCLKYGKERGLDPANPPEPPRPGLTSAIVTEGVPAEFYRAYGFHVCGPRAVRIDMLERLADLIRPLLGWRAKEAGDTPPKGATGDGGFTVVPEMMSILGCSTEELGQVLTALGFRSTKREVSRSELAAAEGGGPLDGASNAPVPAETKVGSEEAGGETASAVSVEAPALPEGAAEELADASSGTDATPGDEGASQVSTHGDGVAVQPTAGEAAVTDEAVAASQPAEPAAEGATETTPKAVSQGVNATDGEVGDAAEVTQDAAESAAANGAAVSEAAVEPDVVVIEVWRPKRRHESGGRRGRGRGRSPQAQREGEQGAAGARNGEGRGRRDQEDGRRRGPPEKRGDGGGRQRSKNKRHDGGRRTSNVHTSSPARQKGIDPDSPFAKLSALKESLNKGGDG